MQSNTNWNLYKHFIVVYETRNINRASEILGVSRPAVSQNIRELGDQLGIVLFNATQRGVEPTQDADKLYPSIKHAMDTICIAEGQLKTFNKDTTGHLSIASHGYFSTKYLNGYLAIFNSLYPNIDISVHQSDGSLLTHKKYDLIIDWEFMFIDTDMKTIPFPNTKMEAVLFASKKYLEKQKISTRISREVFMQQTIADRYEPWVNYWKWCGLGELPKKFIKAQSADQILNMIDSGMGIGIYGKSIIESMPNFVQIQVEGIKLRPNQMVCAYSTLTRPARAFLDGLVKYCKDN